jgi:hypothetical protein
MGKQYPTYVRDNGEVLAFFEGRVIARSPSFAKTEETAVDYLDNLQKKRDENTEEKVRKAATHVTTPNGLKGEILSRVDGIWGEKELTVRFENGRIAKFSSHGGEVYSNERSASTATTPIAALREELDGSYDHNVEGLTERTKGLSSIVRTASSLLEKGASYSDESDLHKIVLEAEHEKGEVESALDYLKQADAEVIDPIRPEFKAEQADFGHSKDNNWLDHTVQEMIDESEGINFDQVLEEEPPLFAAELETGTLADQGATAEMALSHITAKTAAFQGPEVEAYREKYVGAVEMARRAELADRKEAMHKQASEEQSQATDAPDEALFL